MATTIGAGTLDSSDRELLIRMNTGPRFLFLGQQSALDWRGDASESGAINFPSDGLPDLDALVGKANSASIYAEYDARIKHEPMPNGIEDVARIPWNGVFTSRIDSSLRQLFEAEWRRAVPTTKAQVGRHSRNASELLIRMLFGGLALPPEEKPPLDIFEAAEVESRAAEVMSALASTIITPRGVIAFDGWMLDDWFSPKQVFTFATKLTPGQLHLFSATDSVRENTFLNAAIGQGAIIAHEESLAEYILRGESEGKLTFSMSDGTRRQERLIPIGDSFVELDVDVWNQVTGSARPIDISLLEPFGPASEAVLYQRFRGFLGSAEGAPPWKAIASGFKLTRDFESDLRHRVAIAIRDPLASEPIVVAGQTSTGKSMALAALAIELARAGSATVLHQSRRRDRPNLADVDAFAMWAEQSGSASTVLIWDGMVDPDEYYALQRELRSRGRRVVIVGTAYGQPLDSANLVKAEATMTRSEISRIGGWLGKFGIEYGHHPMHTDSSFLALLYRVLPETEQGLRTGLSLEVRTVESKLEALSRDRSKGRESRLGAIAQALADAGLDIEKLLPSDRPDADLVTLAFEERSTAERLTALILVSGRHGVPLPLELALRVLGRDASTSITELVNNFDIFRWTEDENGDQFLGTRTNLEAELLAREDLSIDGEIEVLVEVIQALRPDSSRSGGGDVQFIADLIDRIGPQSDGVGRYWRHYRKLADAFSHLRESEGRIHARLILQEANLTREYIQRSEAANLVESAERIKILINVQHILEEALQECDASPRTRLNLLVELASSVGAQVYALGRSETPPEAGKLESLMKMVVETASKARAIDPENIYPVDVVAWSTERALNTGVLDEGSRVDMLANAVASLESLDVEGLSPKQKATYDRRRVELARIKGDSNIETKHLVALMENNDPAAYYFLAKDAAGAGVEGIKTAVGTLRNAPQEIRDDWRCAGLLLDLFWRMKSGKDLLRGERQLVAFRSIDWEECLDVADLIPNVVGYDRIRAEFMRGIAHFNLGSFNKSKQIFGALDRETSDLGSRIIAKYLVSNPDGTPHLFTGSVSWASPDGRRGTIWVEEIGAEINFIPLRFSVSEYRQKGDPLPRFHIAFNLRGALAEPVRHGSSREVGGMPHEK
ncbi:hypothetical protein HC744_06060 [Arthrobacter sp. S1_S22]|nr:hypothetical protein [Arthrobacter sp. S1_S22]